MFHEKYLDFYFPKLSLMRIVTFRASVGLQN